MLTAPNLTRRPRMARITPSYSSLANGKPITSPIPDPSLRLTYRERRKPRTRFAFGGGVLRATDGGDTLVIPGVRGDEKNDPTGRLRKSRTFRAFFWPQFSNFIKSSLRKQNY